MTLSIAELNSIAQARLMDAEVLLANGRYDGSKYLCGYAVEIALKSRIVKTLSWDGFPKDAKDFSGLQSFETHDLEVLLKLSGRQVEVRKDHLLDWSAVSMWDPESRYELPGSVTQAEPRETLENSKRLVGVLS